MNTPHAKEKGEPRKQDFSLSHKRITILIPAYNEAENIPLLIDQLDNLIDNNNDRVDLKKYSWEYLFVNDGSKDNTLDVLNACRKNNLRVNILDLSRNFGKENAMLAGMDFICSDATIIMDADLQDPVEVIPEMVYQWEHGYDDVYGRRKSRGKESWLRKRLSLMFYSLLQNSTQIEILQNVGDFRLLDQRVVKSIRSMRETQRYTKGLFSWVGYNKKEIAFDREDRAEGKSSFNFKRLFNLAVEGITSFTTSPLRISSIIGFILSFFSLIYIIKVLIKTLIWGEPVSGFPTLICVILLLGGFQLIALGIIGEYIARIFNETKQRPPYIASSYNGEKV
ncbi:MAG: glycosyltransferase family 2 protein [Muribaculaceae bacterium]|nr:glycosyltransferase family 2 protein [Muribaculaceae bacterium]